MSAQTRRTRGQRALSADERKAVRALAHPDFWAQSMGLMVDGHPFNVDGREYQRAIIRDNSRRIIVPKAAQMGLTVIFLVRTMHWIVTRKWHHLYMLPLKTGTGTFVQQRIDPMIDFNKALKAQFQRTDNKMHKQSAEGIALYIRGSNIWNELREIPTDAQVWDERDRMNEDYLPEAEARLGGSEIKHVTELSTPTIPGHGVDDEGGWNDSDQHRWEVPCPHCGTFQVLDFKENVKLGDTPEECVCECSHCRKVLTDLHRREMNALGHWTPFHLNGNKRGYHISQLNSPTQPLVDFMLPYFEGLSETKKMRAFYNNQLGLPFVAYGDQLTPELLDKCIKSDYRMGGIPIGPLFIGVDVGTVLHVRVDQVDRFGRRMPWALKVFSGPKMFRELDEFLSGLYRFTCVIDAHPEKTEAAALSIKYPGQVWVGFPLDRPEQDETAVFEKHKRGEVAKVNIDLCMAMDDVIADYMNGKVVLPPDARELGEARPRLQWNGFYDQMIQMARVEEEDTKGRIRAFWRKNKKKDHWHSADMFVRAAMYKKPRNRVSPEMAQLIQSGGRANAA